MDTKKIIVAIDTIDKKKINYLLSSLKNYTEIFKIGLQAFTYFGPQIIKLVQKNGYKVFLDLKLHDIPNTVAKAIESAIKLDVHMLTIHTLGGEDMLKEVMKVKNQFGKPIILGVTILTSMDDNSLNKLNFNLNLTNMVKHLAIMGKSHGIDGVVCSPKEITLIRKCCGNNFLIVTPGIRFDKGKDDQKRTLTPKEAFELGSDYIVVGRPILQAESPEDFFKKIMD